jgi:hypothetical protein
LLSGLPDFSWYNIPIQGKLPQNIPNGRKIDQMAIKLVCQQLPMQEPPKFTQIGIFGLKKNLATLIKISRFELLPRFVTFQVRSADRYFLELSADIIFTFILFYFSNPRSSDPEVVAMTIAPGGKKIHF